MHFFGCSLGETASQRLSPSNTRESSDIGNVELSRLSSFSISYDAKYQSQNEESSSGFETPRWGVTSNSESTKSTSLDTSAFKKAVKSEQEIHPEKANAVEEVSHSSTDNCDNASPRT